MKKWSFHLCYWCFNVKLMVLLWADKTMFLSDALYFCFITKKSYVVSMEEKLCKYSALCEQYKKYSHFKWLYIEVSYCYFKK